MIVAWLKGYLPYVEIVGGSTRYNLCVVSNEGLMLINSSTIANNMHSGFTDRQIGNAGELQMSNTIVVGTGNGEECGGVAPIISQGHNLHADGSCGAAVQSDIPFGNAALLALADNGGLGKTHALTVASDAIDAGNCNNGTLSKDQRGVSRPQGDGCDIGAFELEHDGGNSTGEGGAEPGGDSDTEDESESSTGADTNDDTADGAVVHSSGGGGAMLGIGTLLPIILMVVCRRRLIG